MERAREGGYLVVTITPGANRPMRATTLLNNVLGIKFTQVVAVHFEAEGVVCEVKPTTAIPRCAGCGAKSRKIYDRRRNPRRWRHLDLGGMVTHLEYRMRRVRCPRCGVCSELVPWAAHDSWFTWAFEETAGFLAQASSKSFVAKMMGIAWSTVGSIARSLVQRFGPRDPLAGLTHIGIDELSYRRHHEYVTVVVDHLTGRVVWVRRGKNAETAKSFFDELGPERSSAIEVVTIDMSKAYVSAVQQAAPKARLVFDRFHVQRLVHDALDTVRRAEVRQATEPQEKTALKNTRFALQKNPWNLNDIEATKLATVQRTNRRLYRAYLLKEVLAGILDRRQPSVVERMLLDWISWATHSGLAPFAKAARTLRGHIAGIVGYIATGLSNARVEGLNGKIRTITRRSYGFHSVSSLIAMIFLCCSGIRLQPARVLPRFHQTS